MSPFLDLSVTVKNSRPLINLMRSTYILLFLLILTSVSAATFFEGEQQENKFFTVDGQKVQFDYYKSAARISFNAYGTWTQIDMEGCEVVGQFDVCLNSEEGDIEDENGETQYILDITISDLSPKVTIELEADDETVDVDQQVEFEVKIFNEGNSAATGLQFRMEFPDSLDLYSSSETKVGNLVTWSGSIEPGKSKTIDIVLDIDEFKDFKVKGEVTSTYGGNLAKVESNEVEVSINLPYDLEMSYSDKTLKPNEILDVEMLIENNDAQTLKFDDLVFTFPEEFKLLSSPSSFSEDDNTLTLSKTFDEGDKATYEFSFQAKKDGDYIFNVEADAKLPDFDIISTFDEKISVNSKDALGIIEIEDEINERSSYKLKALVKNLVDEDIDATYQLTSDLFVNIFKKTIEIDEGESYEVLESSFKAPDVDQDTKFTITLKVNGIEFSREITVKAIKELLEFREEIDVDGDEARVVVYAINKGTKELENVDLIDEAPLSVKITGEQFATVNLPVGETKVYDYFVLLKDELKEVTLTHTANAKTDDGLYILETDFEIEFESGVDAKPDGGLKEELVDLNEESPKNELVDDSKDVSVKEAKSSDAELGFFSSIFSGIAHIFSTIFG